MLCWFWFSSFQISKSKFYTWSILSHIYNLGVCWNSELCHKYGILSMWDLWHKYGILTVRVHYYHSFPFSNINKRFNSSYVVTSILDSVSLDGGNIRIIFDFQQYWRCTYLWWPAGRCHIIKNVLVLVKYRTYKTHGWHNWNIHLFHNGWWIYNP